MLGVCYHEMLTVIKFNMSQLNELIYLLQLHVCNVVADCWVDVSNTG